MPEDITRFSGDYAWLSNFYPVVVELDGELYPSTENAYQAAKSLDPAERQKFTDVKAAVAKRMGREIKNKGKQRKDWESVNIGIMKDLLRQKFSESPFKEKLLATYPCELIEGNWHRDVFWGVCYPDSCPTGVGENMLGKLLMQIRDELLRGTPKK